MASLLIHWYIALFIGHIFECIGQYIIDCNNHTFQCQQYLNCPADQDCLVQCGAPNGCQEAIINCPINGNCNVQCNADDACYNATINAADNQQLNVSCTVENSCDSASFNSGNGSEVNIHCTKGSSCYKASFKALQASWLRLLNCATEFLTCIGITVWCPSNVNGEKRCIVQGILILATTNSNVFMFFVLCYFIVFICRIYSL